MQSRYTGSVAHRVAVQLIERIHASPCRLVVTVAGGGAGAISALLEVPGASRTVLEAVVPYCEAAMIAWLHARPDQFCCEPTARAMAMAAYCRACQYAEADRPGELGCTGPLAGVACTASLATDRPKRGSHRIHVAFQTASATVARSVELLKGHRTRSQEEHLAAGMVLNAVAEACGLEERLAMDLHPDEHLVEARAEAPQAWQDLLAGRVLLVRHGGLHSRRTAERPGCVVFPGAFNPLHSGHRRMAEIAQAKLGAPVEFEICMFNVDKPPLDFIELQRRTSQFEPSQTVWLTRAPTFEQKSALFPGATFVVGTDTLRRIADPRYTGGTQGAWLAALERIAERGCRFLVFGRMHEGRFVTLDDLELPPMLRTLCQSVPADEFREDICSTWLRQPT